MPENLVARAAITIHATASSVWDALTNPELIRKYMFGTNTISDWKKGSPIVWKGEWKGKAYEDKGQILEIIPNKLLSYTHFSPLTGEEDMPENYHTVTIELQESSEATGLILTQDKNATEEAKAHSEENWKMVLEGLKKVAES
jgi:uncharacterized protein YndB with AHSA1/START domain